MLINQLSLQALQLADLMQLVQFIMFKPLLVQHSLQSVQQVVALQLAPV